MDTDFTAARTEAAELDRTDPLAGYRNRFSLPDGLIYLDGNSLGPASHAAFRDLQTATRQEWAEGLIRSWNAADWFVQPQLLGGLVAEITGAAADEVVVCDSTSVNIFKAVTAALSLRPGRRTVLVEPDGFPTDGYMLQGLAQLTDIYIRPVSSASDLRAALEGGDVACALLNHVDYRTGALRDLPGETALVQEYGALAIWDLCHSAGVMPVELNAANADLAVGCTYKYLNGGPGAPAFIFCAKRHQAAARQPLSGWWGHREPFAFRSEFEAAPDMRKFLCGTQPVLSLRGARAGLEIAAEANLTQVRQKSLKMTALFRRLVTETCSEYGVNCITPEGEERGSQIALTHPEAFPVMQALIAAGVIGDMRAPDILRFGFAPLYNSFADVTRAAEILHDVLAKERWKAPEFQQRSAVT